MLSVFLLLAFPVSALLTNVQLDQCHETCKALCDACAAQPSPTAVLSCLTKETKDKSCLIEARLTERWDISHYCVSGDSFVGGWGFRLPLWDSLVPAEVKEFEFNSTLYPTTGPRDILVENRLGMTVTILRDEVKNVTESRLHQCNLVPESAGVTSHADLEVVAEAPEMKGARRVRIRSTDPKFTEKKSISNDQFLFTIVGDAKKLANGGVLPPALDGPSFQIVHEISM